MIPLISILNLINFTVPIILSIRIYKIYQKNRSDLLFYFSASCFFFSFYWLGGSFSGLIFTDLGVIGVLSVFKFIFLYLSLFFIVKIPTSLIEQRFLDLFFSFLLMIGLFIFISVGFLNLSPAEMVITSPYVYWVPTLPHWIEFMTGILVVLVLSIFILAFIYLAWRDWSNPAIVRRSLSIIVGMGVMMIGSIFRFLTVSILAFYFGYALSNLFVSMGLLIIADGILYEHKKMPAKSCNKAL